MWQTLSAQTLKDRGVISPNLKRCGMCGVVKDATDFALDHSADDCNADLCYTCGCDRMTGEEETAFVWKGQTKAYGTWDKKNTHAIVRRELLISQEGRCAICGVPQVDMRKPLSLDHNHETGVLRGLLCGQCNTLIGMSHESVEVLQNAIQYLIAHESPE